MFMYWEKVNKIVLKLVELISQLNIHLIFKFQRNIKISDARKIFNIQSRYQEKNLEIVGADLSSGSWFNIQISASPPGQLGLCTI